MERIKKGVLRREEEFTDARVTIYFSCGRIRFQNYNTYTLFSNQSWSYMGILVLDKANSKRKSTSFKTSDGLQF